MSTDCQQQCGKRQDRPKRPYNQYVGLDDAHLADEASRLGHMKRLGRAEFEVRFLHGEIVVVQPQLEVSLDCTTCRRRHRTVVFDQLGVHGRCTPTGHEFDGRVSSIERRPSGAVAEFRYHYEPFTDTKYPDEKRYVGFERGAPSWVRFHFHVRCLKCGETSVQSTQTNIVRPWKCMCACGASLYVDEQEPRVSWRSEEA